MQNSRQTFNVVYSLDDLRSMIDRPMIYKPVNFYKDTPIHLTIAPDIHGEVFIEGKVYNNENSENEYLEVFASNYGRVRIGNDIYLQETGKGDNYNYLYLKGYKGDYLPAVHRIIAFIWCERPTGVSNKDLKVHHINNNGFDNRPCNLLWVTNDEHKLIEQDYLLKSKKYTYDDYRYI